MIDTNRKLNLIRCTSTPSNITLIRIAYFGVFFWLASKRLRRKITNFAKMVHNSKKSQKKCLFRAQSILEIHQSANDRFICHSLDRMKKLRIHLYSEPSRRFWRSSASIRQVFLQCALAIWCPGAMHHFHVGQRRPCFYWKNVDEKFNISKIQQCISLGRTIKIQNTQLRLTEWFRNRDASTKTIFVFLPAILGLPFRDYGCS